jgi:hypothetical protein
MAEKTEYREYEDGEWGPWQKPDGGWREDERVEFLPCRRSAEDIWDEYVIGKMDKWTARKYLKRELSKLREDIYWLEHHDVKKESWKGTLAENYSK